MSSQSDEAQRAIENEQDKAVKWDKSAKGRGNRWRMMRDVVAALALRPMNLTMTQNAMMRLRGLSHGKVHEMMMELEGAGDIKPTSGKIGETAFNGWAATDRGVHFWLEGTRLGIPAGLVRVLPIMSPAAKLEEPPGEPEYEDV